MVDNNPGQLEFLPLAMAIGATNKVTVSALHPGSLPPELDRPNCDTPRRVLSGKLPDWEWGYKQQQAPEAAESANPFARLRALHQVETQETTIPFSYLQRLANDGNTLVRRETLRVLCQTGDARAIATLEAALSDPDHAVRCTAVIALRVLNGPHTIDKIFSAIRISGNYQFDAEATRTLAALINSDVLPLLLRGACDSNTRVRCAALLALRGKPLDSTTLSCLLNRFNDPSPRVRWSAIIALTSQSESAPLVERLLISLHDLHPTVRVAAAFALGQIAQTKASKVEPWQDRVLAALKQRYQSFGDSYRGSDRDWAFKSTGAALLNLGPNGQKVLRTFLNQQKDRRLADLAWRSLYLPQDGALRYHLATAAEAEAAYRLHPNVRNPR
jgi:HEAT repeat protein